ncbi:GntR family transcriptional regulator [Microterricola pindariensis]|uniref:GntR family transcriptional regulator n=1 Tax=Microterricola pindariensis TaxID=478010 RepID=UPI000CEBCF0F|nr:GntR family transcriptional regulator [Microterricola pindariensis]
MITDERPIFMQIAERVENDIIDGALPEEGQVPSTNEFAAFYRINPATALKGVNLLVDDGILYKKRGIGMFVSSGARERLVSKRRDRFVHEYLHPLLAEAAKLGISPTQLGELLRDEASATASAATPTSASRKEQLS